MERLKYLALAEGVVSDPGFGFYKDRSEVTKIYAGSVYKGILSALTTLEGITGGKANSEEIIRLLRALPQSQLAAASAGSSAQFAQVLKKAFGLDINIKQPRLRKELSGSTLSELIYYTGWLARLAADGTIQLYQEISQVPSGTAEQSTPVESGNNNPKPANVPGGSPGRKGGRGENSGSLLTGGLSGSNADRLMQLKKQLEENNIK